MVFDPGQLILFLGVEALYLRALHVLRGRGVSVPTGQIVLWHLGIALWAIGFFSPIHTLGEDLLSAHMAQHLLIADLAAPFLLADGPDPALAHRDRAVGDRVLLPRPHARRGPAVRPHGAAPADRGPGGAVPARRRPQPGADVPAPAPRAGHARALAAARRVPVAAPAARSGAGVRAGAVQLALLDLLRGRRPPPLRTRAAGHRSAEHTSELQ